MVKKRKSPEWGGGDEVVQSSGAWQRRAVKQKGRCHFHHRGRCRHCRRPVSSGIHYRIRLKPGSWEDQGWHSNPSRDQDDQARLTLVDLGIVGVGRKEGGVQHFARYYSELSRVVWYPHLIRYRGSVSVQ